MPSEVPDISRLYDAHARQVWRTLVRLGVGPPGVEDAVQDVFLTAHQRLAGFEERSSPLTWLLGIAVRVAANHRRKRTHLSVVPDLPSSAATPDEALDQRRRLAALERVLSQLPEEQREVVVLMDLEQLTAPQVAEALEVKLNTVYSRLRLGRAALNRALTGAPQEVR